MTIREIQTQERDQVGELRVSAYRALGLLAEDSPYAERLRRFGFPDGAGSEPGDSVGTVLVALDEAGAITGTIALERFGPDSELARDATEADIRAFAVDAGAQGRGTGRRLLQAVVDRAAGDGLRRLRLCTQPDMTAAQHLYETAGFTRTPDLDWEPSPGVSLRAYQLDLPGAG